MASTAKLSYQRLKQEIFVNEGDIVAGRSKNRRLRTRRKLRVKIPRLKNLLRKRANLIKIVWSKVCKRFKESQPNFGDLFAGNYLFMQITPSLFKCAADN